MDRDEYFDSAARGLRPSSDFEWYAVDCKGRVAFLSSAGFGAIPLLVLRNKIRYYEVADSLKPLPNDGSQAPLSYMLYIFHESHLVTKGFTLASLRGRRGSERG